MTAVYVDDYILAAVEDASGSLLTRIGRAALHTIHAIFPPPILSGHVDGKDPISQKKLEANDARWAPEKVILGFVIDGAARTVRLLEVKAADLAMATRRLLAKKRVALKVFQSIVGRLRNAATILPAARSLFTPINRALRGLGRPTVSSGQPCLIYAHWCLTLASARHMCMSLSSARRITMATVMQVPSGLVGSGSAVHVPYVRMCGAWSGLLISQRKLSPQPIQAGV